MGKKLHENLAKMTCKNKITIGKRGSILPSDEQWEDGSISRCEQDQLYVTRTQFTVPGGSIPEKESFSKGQMYE